MTEDGTGRGLDLERTLAEIGAGLDHPEADVAPVVVARLKEERGPDAVRLISVRRSGRPVLAAARRWRAAVVAASVVALVASGVLLSSPGARQALAGWLGLRGVRIEQTPGPPRGALRPLGEGLDLGRRRAIPEAEDLVGFRILLPSAPGLSRPDEVWVRAVDVTHDEVFLVYRARPGLPETRETGVGMLLSEFRAGVDVTLLKKVTAGSGRIDYLNVGGEPAYWIEGVHDVGYVDDDGSGLASRVRLAGNVLLWQRGDITLRLESALSKDQAVRIAESMA